MRPGPICEICALVVTSFDLDHDARAAAAGLTDGAVDYDECNGSLVNSERALTNFRAGVLSEGLDPGHVVSRTTETSAGQSSEGGASGSVLRHASGSDRGDRAAGPDPDRRLQSHRSPLRRPVDADRDSGPGAALDRAFSGAERAREPGQPP